MNCASAKNEIFSLLVSLLALSLPGTALAQNRAIWSGSGVVVGASGEILTNNHVVDGCSNITAQLPNSSPQGAELVARDQENDLAIIRIKSSPSLIAAFREDAPLRIGDRVIALGYPLSGILASTVNLSVGVVSALAGLRDDSRYLQISTPVQPGNSGGPLLDASGHLVGIVTAKLDAIRAVRQWGDIPQNVNFAVKAQVARAFLESRGLKYLTARSDLPLADADVADTAKSFTAYIQCKRSSSVETSLAPSLVAQRALLYDEDPSNSKGKQYVGSVVWRTERVKASGGQQSDIAVRADIEVPDRKFKMTMSFRRNTDASLPASHTVELTFILPPNFRGGGIASVPGILMKSNERARGTPLAGLAVKVTDGFFLVGLSNVEADRVRNIQLLKERSWFDVPLVYSNQRRAIIAIEKGSSGEQTFANAFSVWGETQSTAPPYGDAGRAVKTIPE